MSPAQRRPNSERADPVRDLDQVRQFFATPGPAALFDLPWTPLYLLISFLFHPWLGWLTMTGAAGRFDAGDLGRAAQPRARRRRSRRWRRSARASSTRTRRNVEVLGDDEPARALRAALRESRPTNSLSAVQKGSDGATGISAAVRALRMLLQSLVLALAAYLAIHQEISAGTIIATSILASRALCADRHRGLAMAAFRRRTPGRDASQAVARRSRHREPRTRLPVPAPAAGGRRRLHRAAGGAHVDRFRHQSRPGRRRRAGHHRAVRVRQDDAGTGDHRRLAADTRRGHARRRPASPVLRRGPRRRDRLPAAGRRAVRRHDRRQHRALRTGPRRRGRAAVPRCSPTCTT